MTPYIVKNKITEQTNAVPCGKCPACYKRRVSQWSFRLMQEDKISFSSHFITLTYDTKNIPLTDRGYMSLDIHNVQLFIKRLRKDRRNNGRTIKYYMAGEYGGKTLRPHYHLIIFNCDIASIQECWAQGNIHYGTVSGASVGYTLKYLSKRGLIPQHKNDDRQPEFALMSKGLGKSYLTPAMVKWHGTDKANRMYCNLNDGQKIGMPRYYKNKLYNDSERKAIGAVLRRKMDEKYAKQYQSTQDYTAQFESDKAAFRKMAADRTKNEKL